MLSSCTRSFPTCKLDVVSEKFSIEVVSHSYEAKRALCDTLHFENCNIRVTSKCATAKIIISMITVPEWCSAGI